MYEKYEMLLKEWHLTTYQVSKETGIPQVTLSQWKKRGGSLSIGNLKKLADFFKVKIEYFLE